ESFKAGYKCRGLFFGGPGNLANGGGGKKFAWAEPVKRGDVIGVLVQAEAPSSKLQAAVKDSKLTMTVYQNGRCLGPAFEAAYSGSKIFPVVQAKSAGDVFRIATDLPAPNVTVQALGWQCLVLKPSDLCCEVRCGKLQLDCCCGWQAQYCRPQYCWFVHVPWPRFDALQHRQCHILPALQLTLRAHELEHLASHLALEWFGCGNWTLEKLFMGAELGEYPLAEKMVTATIQEQDGKFQISMRVVNILNFGVSTMMAGPETMMQTEGAVSRALPSVRKWLAQDGKLIISAPTMEMSFIRSTEEPVTTEEI
ncbi:unnamed protein product, partial [Effrenium voratum]